MAKIKSFYVLKGSYVATDEDGKEYLVEIDYWNNKFKIDSKNKVLEDSAKVFLKRKHKVNFVGKLKQI